MLDTVSRIKRESNYSQVVAGNVATADGAKALIDAGEDVGLATIYRVLTQFEQAGITWYNDDKPAFKLVHERIDGDLWIIPGKKPAQQKTVQLRLMQKHRSRAVACWVRLR